MADGGSLYITTDMDYDGDKADEKRVKIVVRDTGMGFDEKIMSQLFTPFLTTKEEGSGLGLAIVKRIVEGLQGEVQGGNHPEGGAMATIRLPLLPSGSGKVGI